MGEYFYGTLFLDEWKTQSMHPLYTRNIKIVARYLVHSRWHLANNYLYRRNVRLRKIHLVTIVLMLLVFSTVALANKDELALWSDPKPVFETGTSSARFSVAHDELGTSFLSIDGLYFREADLKYRLVDQGEVLEEVQIAPSGEVDNPFVFISEGNRHIFWRERREGTSTINYASLSVPYAGHEVKVVKETTNAIQDLHAFQDGENIHFVWSERDSYNQIHYGQVREGELVTTDIITDSADVSIRPAVAVDENGVIHVAWYDTSFRGVDVFYSMKQDSSWSNPRTLGRGDVRDIERGGMVELQVLGDSLYAAWSATPDRKTDLEIYLAEIRRGRSIGGVSLVKGTRPRFIVQDDQLLLFWEDRGEFGSEIYYGPIRHKNISTNIKLTEGRNAGLRPEIINKDGYIYAYWLKPSDRGHQVMEINNQFPRTITFWYYIGIDKENPLEHLFFLISNTIMLTPMYMISQIGVILLVSFAFFSLQRFAGFRNRSLFYQIILIATLFSLARQLPIPKGSLEFLRPAHYGLSVVLATVGTYSVLRPIQKRESFASFYMLLLWAFLFQFFAMLPHNILV